MRPHRRDGAAPAARRVEPTLVASMLAIAFLLLAGIGATRGAGPSFPAPVDGQRVYDRSGIWSPATVAAVDAAIRRIEDRTGAQVVVYAQDVWSGTTGDEARAQAAALGNQWRVGRNGFDDGLVILYDVYPGHQHGQVAIVPGSGFRSAYLDDHDAARIVQEAVLPPLLGGEPDFDRSITATLDRVEARATAEKAAALARARTVNAILAIAIAPLLCLGLIAFAIFQWLRYGRDPVYLDDPSVLMAGPPDGLTPATAALVFEGSCSRRALTAALLDLANLGLVAFQRDPGQRRRTLEVVLIPPRPAGDAGPGTHRPRRPVGPAESFVLERLAALAPDGEVVRGSALLAFGQDLGRFDDALEAVAVDRGWFRDPPRRVMRRWATIAGAEFGAAIVALLVGITIQSSGVLVVSGAIAIAGVVTLVLADAMPARTMTGAMIRAMLAAYRRTLEKTMARARSMNQVVAEAHLSWLTTPDQAVVWAVALGLERDVEAVLDRSLVDGGARAGHGGPWLPSWGGATGATAGGSSGGRGSLFGTSASPDFNGMFAAIGTIGAPPARVGWFGFGGGGSFGGGASGGF